MWNSQFKLLFGFSLLIRPGQKQPVKGSYDIIVPIGENIKIKHLKYPLGKYLKIT